MLESLRRYTSVFLGTVGSQPRIVRISSIIGGIGVLIVVSFLLFDVHVPQASADDVTTSVTVLNTPPVWTVDAQESPESSTTTPTNIGSAVTWVATATDSNAESYYLLICKTGSAPTANSGAPPTCNGGVTNQWAVSTLTSSGAQATAATTTTETAPFVAELNDWYGWICDANASLPRCNTLVKQGTGSTASPFVVNHPPVFVSVVNDSPANPGETIAWTATAYDNDIEGGSDTVRIIVCKSNDFNGTYCGAGGTWATSTLSSSNPSTSTPIAIPTQDRNFSAYVYLLDNHGRVATSTVQGTNSLFVVSNVAPSVTAATVSLEDTDASGNLTLLTPNATTGPFRVRFEVTDNNSCQNASSTNEFTSAIANVYRSGVTSASCQASGDYNSNSCYPAASPNFSGYLSCSQDGGSCSGATDTSAQWTCTYSLWYNADPTDASTPWTAQNWLASIRVTDDDTATSSLTEATTGNDLASFLAFDVGQSSVSFGGLEPGQSNDPLATTTSLLAVGNVGLDEDLYGDTMCTNWTSQDSCDAGGIDPTREIPISNQKAATSSVAYASPSAYTLTGSTTPTEVLINVQKTTSTSSPQQKDTYWGISIPVAITLAGNYTGQNTITAKVSNFLFW